MKPLPNSNKKFSKLLIIFSSKSFSEYLDNSGKPKNSNIYGSFIASCGFSIISPCLDKISISYLFLLNDILSYNDELYCLFNSLKLQLFLTHSIS